MFYIFNRYLSVRTVLILLTESILLFGASFALAMARAKLEGSGFEYLEHGVKTGVLTMVYVIFMLYFNLYTPEYFRPERHMFIRLAEATALATVALFCILYLVPSLRTWRTILVADLLVNPLLILGWRSVFPRFLNLELPPKRVLIIGSGELARKIGRKIYDEKEYGFNLVGFIDDDPDKLGKSVVNPGVIGGYGDIGRLAEAEGVDRIIVALPDRRAKLPMSVLLGCKLRGINIEEGATFNERMTGQIPVDHLKPSWMVFSDGFSSIRLKKLIKRVFDLVFASVLLVPAVPVMLLTGLLVKLDSRGPAIYRQVRVGENGREFNIYKFRSLRDNAESETGPVWNEDAAKRATRVGRVLRKIRLDELPQLVNILKGDMSFVGPRPERPYFVSKLKEEIPYYEMRMIAKPGLTGWAQIKYPYGSSVEDSLEKLQYDIYYIKNMSPLLDILIMLSTIKVILTGRGAK